MCKVSETHNYNTREFRCSGWGFRDNKYYHSYLQPDNEKLHCDEKIKLNFENTVQDLGSDNETQVCEGVSKQTDPKGGRFILKQQVNT